MADWNALEIKIPGKDLLESVRTILETLLVFLEVLKVILETISLFLIDFGNPLRVIIETLLNLITELFEQLRRTGLYAWFDFPNPLQDPSFHRFAGGYQAFIDRFKGSLFDGRDPFRPQATPGSSKSGFVLIVADAEAVFGMLTLVKILLRFFGKEFSSAQYASPTNVKVFPAGTKPGALGGANIDPILQTASIFGADLKGLAVEWSLASNQFPPDPGFSDLVATVGAEFIPQRWLVEKTGREGGAEIASQEVETEFEDKRGRPIKRTIRIRDEYGDLCRKFEKYILIEPGNNTATFLLGQLGTFRYIDTDVTKDKTYYYRVRALSGALDVSGDGSITFPDPEFDTQRQEWIQRWPSKNQSEPVIVGRPSGIVTGRVPNIPPDFDVFRVLEAIFRVAFALDFHQPLSPEVAFGSDGVPTNDLFVGRGSLSNLAGPLSVVIPAGFSMPSDGATSADPVTKQFPDVTYNLLSVKLHSARMRNIVADALLENSGMLEPFRALMQGSLPFSIVGAGYTETGINTLEKFLYAFLTLPHEFPKTYDVKVYQTYAAAWVDRGTRQNVLAAVNFIKSFTLGGVPPDWIQVSLLRDLIPWSGAFIYELLARIDALLAAFKSALDELKAFIELLIRKIEVLERFIKFLIEILNYLDSFSAGFYFLAVASTDGGTPDWVAQIDNAQGTPPPSGPGGYTAGVALAYLGPNVDAFSTAFGLIF